MAHLGIFGTLGFGLTEADPMTRVFICRRAWFVFFSFARLSNVEKKSLTEWDLHGRGRTMMTSSSSLSSSSLDIMSNLNTSFHFFLLSKLITDVFNTIVRSCSFWEKTKRKLQLKSVHTISWHQNTYKVEKLNNVNDFWTAVELQLLHRHTLHHLRAWN